MKLVDPSLINILIFKKLLDVFHLRIGNRPLVGTKDALTLLEILEWCDRLRQLLDSKIDSFDWEDIREAEEIIEREIPLGQSRT